MSLTEPTYNLLSVVIRVGVGGDVDIISILIRTDALLIDTL